MSTALVKSPPPSRVCTEETVAAVTGGALVRASMESIFPKLHNCSVVLTYSIFAVSLDSQSYLIYEGEAEVCTNTEAKPLPA